MPLVHFFETSFSRTTHRRIILVEVASQGVSGWGEVTCGEHPFYNEEWTDAAWMIVRDYVAPLILKIPFESAADIAEHSQHIRGHFMARGGVEAAAWDLEARLKNLPLWEHIGGGWFKEIACGVSIGIQDTVPQLLKTIEKEIAAGYQRIKIKIKPGWDLKVVERVRKEFRGLPKVTQSADSVSRMTALLMQQAAQAQGSTSESKAPEGEAGKVIPFRERGVRRLGFLRECGQHG